MLSDLLLLILYLREQIKLTSKVFICFQLFDSLQFLKLIEIYKVAQELLNLLENSHKNGRIYGVHMGREANEKEKVKIYQR